MNHEIDRREAGALLLSAPFGGAAGAAGATGTLPASGRTHVAWARQASIYEVNLRQYTPEGTLRAFEAHLPRLAKMGVGILWLMPLQPIGAKNRKGTLGSYYSIRDYTAVNPEFGTLTDLRRMVHRAHALGMKVILDWVANHTAWDHPWTEQHPDWFQRNAQGQLIGFTFQPEGGKVEVWDDVVGLNYAARPLWEAMTEAMLFWLREAGFDGFRCDVAGLVPLPFWESVRPKLEAVKPVFMLAEADKPALHAQAFDMSYDWQLYDTLKKLARGEAGAPALAAWWERRRSMYPADAIGMNFTGNHDSNSWDGSDAEFYGSPAAFQCLAAIAALLPGMPLVYGGQEAFFEKRLKFFEKDAIDWGQRRLEGFYTKLLNLKRTHPALVTAVIDEDTLRFHDTGHERVLRFTRRHGGRRLEVTANLSGTPQPTPGGGTLAPWAWSLES